MKKVSTQDHPCGCSSYYLLYCGDSPKFWSSMLQFRGFFFFLDNNIYYNSSLKTFILAKCLSLLLKEGLWLCFVGMLFFNRRGDFFHIRISFKSIITTETEGTGMLDTTLHYHVSEDGANTDLNLESRFSSASPRSAFVASTLPSCLNPREEPRSCSELCVS